MDPNNSMIQHEDEDIPYYYDPQDANAFRLIVLEEKWEEVIKKYEEHVFFHKIRIKGRGTALHVAVSNGNEDIVKRLVDVIVKKHNDQSGLEIKTEKGDTPLHLAAYRGFTSMCECIIGKNGERKHLIRDQNEKGETPLFCTVLAGINKKTFLYLHHFFPSDTSIAINNVGATILHVAIRRETFDMANIIMYLYPNFHSMEDKDGVSPLEDLATRTSAFKSGIRLIWWKEFLYRHYVDVKVCDAKTILELHEKDGGVENKGLINFACLTAIKKVKEKHIYGGKLLEAFMKHPYIEVVPFDDGEHDEEMKEKARCKREGKDLQEREGNQKIEDSAKNVEKDTTFLAVAKSGVVEIMEELNSKVKASDKKGLLLVAMKELEAKKSDTNDTAYLRAAKHGITEIMIALESKLKSVIHETNSNNENALLIAVKYRQPRVVEGLRNRLSMETFQSLILEMDNNENTILHLAAYPCIDNEDTAWKISGKGIEMMWNVKWYEYIDGLVPDDFHYIRNKEGKTPGEIFKEENKQLLQSSIEWLKNTTESSSIVAALVAGVSFATSCTVPGGNDQSGKPNLKGQPAFDLFSTCSLTGLYFSVTSLMVFLSILTCRKQAKDFGNILPFKFFMVLNFLFIAIFAMLFSFFAGQYLLLTDKYDKSSSLLYFSLAGSLPVMYYAFLQFPLYIDLAVVISRKVPLNPPMH
ncbi:uncharacterized protein [Medicago truncatula]|uniref:uncharacterized protein isoform X2 n=1 Tax=Medicago truncatula TaxID=3880 RepID=UPI000D2F453A|nr:uncharacterized protein LOC11421712 isoform X2 [Medicago truncatula]